MLSGIGSGPSGTGAAVDLHVGGIVRQPELFE
jgi:hypothetical protein